MACRVTFHDHGDAPAICQFGMLSQTHALGETGEAAIDDLWVSGRTPLRQIETGLAGSLHHFLTRRDRSAFDS